MIKMKISRKLAERIVIALLLVVAFSLLIVDRTQFEKRSDVEKEIEEINQQITLLQNRPIPDLQKLEAENTSIQTEIAYAKSSLDEAIGYNCYTTLVDIARNTSVKLLSTKLLSSNTVVIDEINYNMMSMKIRIACNTSSLMSFTRKVSEELGAIRNLSINILREGGDNLNAEMDVDMYSYIE